MQKIEMHQCAGEAIDEAPAYSQYPLRFSIDDDDGVLKFRDLRMHGQPECSLCLDHMRKYLVGKPLLAIDVDRMQKDPLLSCRECVSIVAKTISDLQEVFRVKSRRRP